MKCTKTLVIALLAVFVTQTAFSQKGNEEQLIKEANGYFNSGQYLKAFPLYSQLVSLYPNHPDYNYRFGACAIYSDQDKTKAVKFLTIATAKGVEDKMAWYYLGKAYHLNYQFKDAIKAYETFLRNADPKVAAKTDAQREIETCIYGSNLLANVKDISVISKTEADKANFFRYFNLEAIGGKILTVPEELKSKLDQKSTDPGVIHYPGNGTTIYFSSYGKDGATGKDIYKAQVLPDGKFSTPVKLGDGVNTKYDEDYCFMHSDGKTLYFASKGHNSMGGYDIFKCEYDPKSQEFGPAINLDFAINTPDDDIFYIADSLNKKAYFASGRASDMSHLNVYNVMVESTPLQVVYIKGEFFSDINPDQHKAGIKIFETASNRMVCDGISGGPSGNYLMYVPKSGDYNFKVVTENSPKIHDVNVSIPSFGRPVALRQEMRLVSENGQDKLIVTNHFETPLEEDLSVLAAEMLRKKSRLDVNTESSEPIASNKSESTSGNDGELTTFEKNMTNAPIAAGFANGTTIATVSEGMKKESGQIKKFVSESDQKYANSLAFAKKRYQEADAALTEAETIRKSLGTISNDDDIRKLRKSVELTDKAATLQMEAKAAMNAAESIQQYKVSEGERANQLDLQVAELQKAESAGNYDQAVTIMTAEKDRQTALRDGTGNSPVAELQSKAKARESERAREESKLEDLRTEEKALAADLVTAQNNLSAAKKDKEKQAASTEVANAQANLDGTRKRIAQQQAKLEKAGFDAKMAQANVNYFMAVSEDSNYGLQPADMAKVSPTDKSTLAMRLDEMTNRVDAMELKDPQMLALITDASSDVASHQGTQTTGNSASAAHESGSTNSGASVASNTPNGGNTSSSSTETTSVESKSTTPPATVGVNATAGAELKEIKGRRDTMLASIGKQPEMAPARRMVLSQSLIETENEIKKIESKKANGTFSESDNAKLSELTAFRNETRTNLNLTENAPGAVAPEVIRSTYASVDPTYDVRVQNISNGPGNEIEQAIKMMEYKRSTLEKLQSARLANAAKANSTQDPAALSELGKTDAQYEAAILALSNESGDMNQVRAAYDSENKTIIESDHVYGEKLQDQITVTESYIEALKLLEVQKQQELQTATTQEERGSLNAQIAEIQGESETMFKKLDAYRHDLQLTASATEPKSMTGNDQAASTNVESMMADNGDVKNDAQESSTSTAPVSDIPETTVEEDAKNIEKMFKAQEEGESIFAYESGSFEEIVAQHQTADTQLKNREKIREINDNIFLIEAEMENETNNSKLRKLDYKAEQLYLKRSLIEIDNAGAIAKMTRVEYDEELAKANQAIAENNEKIESRIMIRDQVKKLKREADVLMNNAEEIRASAPAVMDDIEKADFYRRAFAKEAAAIDNLKKIQIISDNVDLLLKYSETDLAQLRSGKVPSDRLIAALESGESVAPVETNTTETGVSTDLASSTDANATDTSTSDAGDSQESAGDQPTESSIAANTADGSSTSTESPGIDSNVAAQPETADLKSAGDGSANQVMTFSTSASGDIVTDSKTVVAQPDGNISMNIRADVPVTDSKTVTASAPEINTSSNSGNQAGNNGAAMNTTTERSMLADQGNNSNSNQLKENIQPVADVRNAGTLNTDSSLEKAAIQPVADAGALSRNAASNPSAGSAKAASSASANAEDYYYSMPEVLVADLFKRTTRAVYSEAKPIPVDMTMPKGVYYKVQIGAFRNDIPQNLYDEFAPVSGESVGNGITRYTAGFFMTYASADQIKKEIRSIGYSDAFVVAYRDGKRIPLYEAMGKTDGADFVAAVEKEYVYGDKGEDPAASRNSNSNATKSNSGGNTTSTSNNNGVALNQPLPTVPDYYKGTPNAVAATQVETIKGLFFTVQVGVYSKPVASKNMYNISNLNSELTESKKIRYTAGRFNSMMAAVEKRSEAKNLGIKDAFITAYYNGRRITLSEADRLLKENGASILAK